MPAMWRLVAAAAVMATASAGGKRMRQSKSTKHRDGEVASVAQHTPPPLTQGRLARVPVGGELPHDALLAYKVAGARPEQLTQRPSLINYNPVANTNAVFLSSDRMARFTVLTPRLIRMEYAKSSSPGVFEDHATIAMMNRNLAVPQFSAGESGGVVTIATQSVKLTYRVGQPFSSSSLNVVSTDPSSAFTSWSYGAANPRQQYGTIRGLDGQNNTPLNCTLNAGILDNGENNHCEWGLVSRDGWVVYDDSQNFILDGNDWWVSSNAPQPPRTCTAGSTGTDAAASTRSSFYPSGTTASSAADCCSKCLGASDCVAWVYATDGSNDCWPLAGWSGTTSAANRVFGNVTDASAGASLQNEDAVDIYGFFHGLDFAGALADFVQVSGRTIMAPRYASGVWWSRWYDLNNLDVAAAVDAFRSRQTPLDVFVLDMNWHQKNDWSGFTWDSHLFPFPADTTAYLASLGLPLTVNIHDASGVNNWEAAFPQLASYLGLPPSATVAPLNLVNATWAYAVEDIVMGALTYNTSSIAFFWIDWQQGGVAGGMTGYKQNPTMWLNHLRCTDRHRVGDVTRAMVLARWGGMGGHRYQVGFSGDVNALTWSNMAYQPYFSATSANVAHGFWSHDIEGPADDPEMYTRWIQVGAFSGTMRSHDRGMSAGSCADSNPFSCSVVEPYKAISTYWPEVHEAANRAALQARATLLPLIYNGHRSAFDTGLGLIRPMYYAYPALDTAYAMDGNGAWMTQYMFSSSILFSPVVQPGDSSQMGKGPGLASKTTWLPPGTWVDVNTGVMTTVASTDVNHTVTAAYPITEIPLWYAAGSVIPYIPTRSLPTSVGNAGRQYTALGFRIVPGAVNGSVSVYEDDGATTAYLTANAYAWTTANYARAGTASLTITISTNGTFPELPATRAVQLHLLNSGPLAAVTVNGASVPFVRFGRVNGQGKLPASAQHWYDVSAFPWGMGAIIDIPSVSTTTGVTTTISITYAVPTLVTDAAMSGVYGAVQRALASKGNLDEDRSTPGSNTPDPAYVSVLASLGGALEYLAGANATGFADAINSVPSLLASARTEVASVNSPRTSYSLGLLQF